METTLGSCRILSEIGRGATGTVYKAERDGEPVAIKVLNDRWSRSAAAADRFVQEGMILSQLSHEAIVQVLDVGRDQGKFYLILEYVDGPSFAAATRDRALPSRDVARILSSVARGLNHAHRRGVIHSDIVPGNILLKKDGSPKLADFGIARLRGKAWKSGVTAGTPIYMSPEQASGLSEVIDVRSDVYSLGAVLYEAVTGRAPYVGRSTEEVLEKVVLSAPQPPRKVDPLVDPGLEAIILKAMDKNPAGRYPTAAGFADALDAWLRSAREAWCSMVPLS